MGRHRSRLQIIADVLCVVSGGARKTHVMQRARLSYTLLCRYLAEVVKADLVSFENEIYVLTRKGQSFLDKFDVYSQHCQHLNDRLDTVTNERIELEKMLFEWGLPNRIFLTTEEKKAGDKGLKTSTKPRVQRF